MPSNRPTKPGEILISLFFNDALIFFFIKLDVNLKSAELASQTNMVGKAKQRVEQIEEQLHQAR